MQGIQRDADANGRRGQVIAHRVRSVRRETGTRKTDTCSRPGSSRGWNRTWGGSLQLLMQSNVGYVDLSVLRHFHTHVSMLADCAEPLDGQVSGSDRLQVPAAGGRGSARRDSAAADVFCRVHQASGDPPRRRSPSQRAAAALPPESGRECEARSVRNGGFGGVPGERRAVETSEAGEQPKNPEPGHSSRSSCQSGHGQAWRTADPATWLPEPWWPRSRTPRAASKSSAISDPTDEQSASCGLALQSSDATAWAGSTGRQRHGAERCDVATTAIGAATADRGFARHASAVTATAGPAPATTSTGSDGTQADAWARIGTVAARLHGPACAAFPAATAKRCAKAVVGSVSAASRPPASSADGCRQFGIRTGTAGPAESPAQPIAADDDERPCLPATVPSRSASASATSCDGTGWSTAAVEPG